MAIADFLSDIGQGLTTAAKTAGRVAGAVAPVLGKAVANEEAGYSPQIAAEGRQRQYQLEDEQIAQKAAYLNNQLAMGQKYNTLTPEQVEQYTKAISDLYSHPRHAPALMDALRKAVHPNGAVAGPAPTLPSAMPEGGTAEADEQRAERLAAAKLAAKPKKDFDIYLDKYAADHDLGSVDSMTAAQYEDALHAYSASKRAERMKTSIVEDPDSPTHFSAATYDLTTGKLISSFPGVLPPRGMIPTERLSKSTDQYGNTTTTVSRMTPQLPGSPGTERAPIPTHPEPPKPTGGSAASAPSTTPKKSVASALGGVARPVNKAPAAAPSAPKSKSLDASGHIPPGAGNPQLVEAANQLLDGSDKDKIPAKAREHAAALAREYGWEQGTFTPREKIQVTEAANFLRRLSDSPSLSVLDSTVSRMKIAQALRASEHQGVVGTQLTQLVSRNLSPEESEFIRLYNAAAGTISGLAPLTRGGRPVESSIRRLMAELPNVLQSSGSADAKERVKNLLQEIEVATTTKGTTPMGGKPSNVLPIVVSPEDLK
jgi:hypothetical protein